MFNIFKVLGKQSDIPAGKNIGEVHLDARAIKVNQMLTIKDVGADYAVLITDAGKLLVCTAAVTITLPAPTAAMDGIYVDIYNAANSNVTVATATTDTLVTDNDATADSVAWSTSSHKIGSGGRFVCHPVGGVASWIFIDWTASASGAAATIVT